MRASSISLPVIAAISLLVAVGPVDAQAIVKADAATCPADNGLANLVASSDLIVTATPNVPISRLQSALREESPDYIDVPLAAASTLKGVNLAPNVTLKVYPDRVPYAPSPETLIQRSGKPSLLFLSQVAAEQDEERAGLYLARSPAALQDASDDTLEATRAELRRQNVILKDWTTDTALPHFAEVKDLLASLPHATAKEQERIFRKLEAFGNGGVPAIIAQMDDGRPLAIREITLVNHDPNAFEGLRHYGPQVVADALDAILNQITGYGGDIVNGGSERQRQAAVAAWRVYAADLKCR